MPQPTSVAICLLYREGKLLMQLRDNIPTILYPGIWGLFGGHIEAGETPEIAVVREIFEEITYGLPSDFQKFGTYGDEIVHRHVFHAPLTVPIKELNLQEGWDLGLFTPAQIATGFAYSGAAKESRPIGPVHQKILLEFVEKHPQFFLTRPATVDGSISKQNSKISK
jgi:8-oxo-dGTP diphosphatase